MKRPPGSLRRRVTLLVAAAVVMGSYVMTRERSLSKAESEQVAGTFRFTRTPLAEVADHPPYKYVRKVHPSVQHICAYVSTLGASVTLGDLDGDGLQNDVIWVDPRTDQVICGCAPGTPARYETFALAPGPSIRNWDPATMCPQSSLMADFNEDGLMDVLNVQWGRSPIIYLRKTPADSNSKTPPSAAEFAVQELIEGDDRWYSSTAVAADLDGNGHLDLIVGNYLPDGSRMLDANAQGLETLHDSLARSGNGGGLRFFRFASATSGQHPTVRFEQQTDAIAEELTHGWSYAIGPVDLDGDLLPEIYVANDFGPDRLLHNRSTLGHFQFAALHGERTMETPASCVINHDSFKGMGVDIGDINDDGLLDIYVSNLTSRFGLIESHFLWLNTGQAERMKDGIAPFRQVSEELGLSRSGWSWDCRLADLNNDGVLEALQANGFIKGTINKWPELQSLGTSNNQLLHNPKFWPSLQPGDDVSGHDTFAFFVRASDGRYYDAAPKLTLKDGQSMSEAMVTRGISLADVDADGRLDFAVANQWQPSYLYHNECPQPGNFLGLHLLLPLEKGKATLVEPGIGHTIEEIPGRPAVGAAVTVRMPDGGKRVAQVDAGSGYAGKRAPDVHLGLGKVAEVPVEIRWRDPDGNPHQETFDLKVGWHTIRLAWPADKEKEL
ncbi:MAG TPA: CRTAC1 family protein [Pirellulales bacterium]|nr:CRTAC1 family protein [Pirellulales bacterium]